MYRVAGCGNSPEFEPFAKGELADGSGSLGQQILDAGSTEPILALRPENCLNLLRMEGYQKNEYGYCVFPEDGGGYMEICTMYPNSTPEMPAWYFRWVNIRSKNMPEIVEICAIKSGVLPIIEPTAL